MLSKVDWLIPLFSALVWLSMLLALLLTWVCDGKPIYPSMDPGQTIAYISDVGAQGLKPLFIAMGAVTVVTLNLSLIAERWLRHLGKLQPNTSWFQKSLSIISILAATVGALGLILLTIFDTLRYPNAHDAFLVVFIAGYIVSAVFVCWEFQRLGKHFREQRILRMSFWVKLFFILLEVALAIAFGVCNTQSKWNAAAVLEWTISFIFTFYVASFVMDLFPAAKTKHHISRESSIEVAERGAHFNGYA